MQIKDLIRTIRVIISELRWPGFAAFSIIAFGVAGYAIIEKWNIFDSLYMTIITLGGIGYGEVHPLSHEGRAFTMLLISLGLITTGSIFTIVTNKIIQRQFISVFQRRKMREEISSLLNHTIICGYGRLARSAAKELQLNNLPVVVIENMQERAELALQSGFLVVRGDAASDEILKKAGIQKAKNLITVLPKDADNLYVILNARELAPKITIITRSEDEAGEKRLLRAGADKVVSPHRMGGLKIAEGVLKPFVTEFFDVSAAKNGTGLIVEEIRINDQSPLANKTLKESKIRQSSKIMIAAIIKDTGEMELSPDGDTILHPNSTLIVLGTKQSLLEFEKIVTI